MPGPPASSSSETPQPPGSSSVDGMPNDANVSHSGQGGDILGDNTTDLKARTFRKHVRSYRRIWRHQFTQTSVVKNRIPLYGDPVETDLYVVPLGNALTKSMLPSQWTAVVNDSCKIRIIKCAVRIYAISPFVTAAKQDFVQVQTTPNLYTYALVDRNYILPNYNVNEAQYDSGTTEIGVGVRDLKKWKLYPEPQTMIYLNNENRAYCHQNLNLYNHPDFQLVSQTDGLHVEWTNRAETEWFHPLMPWGTNFDPHFVKNILKPIVGGSEISQNAIGALKEMMAGYQTHFFMPNITWGGNPTVAPTVGYHNDSEGGFDRRPIGPFGSATATDTNTLGGGSKTVSGNLDTSKVSFGCASVGAYGSQCVRGCSAEYNTSKKVYEPVRKMRIRVT